MAELRRDLATGRFWARFLTHSFAAVGAIAVVLSTLDILFPSRLVVHGVRWALGILAASFIYGLVQSWPRPIEQAYSSPNTTIRVVKGDLLEEKGHLVIGTCDTFDTFTPNVIARGSLQGQALDRLFGGDVAELDRRIDEALSAHTPVGTVEKPGKQYRYELGTIAVLREPTRKVFFLAYSEMDQHNQARSTPDRIWKSLLSLWEEVSRYGNGGSVSIPVIGGGQSRMSQVLPAQDSIRFIALSFMFASREEKICDELRVVVRPLEYSRLDRPELQSFLSSLRPS
jgi:hypothetical protein